MRNFSSYLVESREANEEKLTHLEHAEDHVLNAGHEGFSHAYNNLMDVHNKLSGNKNDTRVTMKYDGSPSVVFGTNPDNGRFFVASKSVFQTARAKVWITSGPPQHSITTRKGIKYFFTFLQYYDTNGNKFKVFKNSVSIE